MLPSTGAYLWGGRKLIEGFHFLHYSRSLNNIILSNVVSFCWWEKELIPSQGHCLCGVCIVSPCGFSLGPLVSALISKIACEVNWCIYVVPVWMSAGVCVSECALCWNGILSRVDSCLASWAAGSGHLWPWIGISCLENHCLTCFYSPFLNVCIAHNNFNA